MAYTVSSYSCRSIKCPLFSIPLVCPRTQLKDNKIEVLKPKESVTVSRALLMV